MDWKKITHLPYWIFKAKGSGLLKTPKDDRDFNVGIFGWGDYTPKHIRWIITTLSIKNQFRNTCQWNATIVQKEPDEALRLSVRRLVSYAKRKGYISGDGFSNLRSGQLSLKDYGAEREFDENETNWEIYSNIPINTVEAAKHKTSSFWSVSSRNEILKLLDEGRILTTGIEWFTGYNQGGGFSSPWIISKPIGYSVGGHAIAIIGYDLNYNGKKVYIMQNSYGKDWGDDGKFYIEMSFLENNNYGIYVNIDVPVDTGKFLNTYDGKNVKGSKPTIYFIQRGVKKAYPDEVTYLAYNVLDTDIRSYSLVKDDMLDKVPSGDNMDIEKSIYWDMLRNVEGNEARIQKLIELLHG